MKNLLILIFGIGIFSCNDVLKYEALLSNEQIMFMHGIDSIIKDIDNIPNDEWVLSSYMFASIGYWNIYKKHPELNKQCKAGIEKCIEQTLDLWYCELNSLKENPDNIYRLKQNYAVIGYLNLMLSIHHSIDHKSKYAGLNNLITKVLINSLDTLKNHLLETYEEQLYPPDNAVVLGSIGIYLDAMKQKPDTTLKNIIHFFKENYISTETGLVFQSVGGAARGSGSTYSVYFLYYLDKKLSEDIYKSIKTELWDGIAVKENLNGSNEEDIDSGPVIMGYSFSANAFMIGSAVRFKDYMTLRKLNIAVLLSGDKTISNNILLYNNAGILGNCILFAMFSESPVQQ